MNFEVEIVAPITIDEEIVSSSQIRKLLIEGNLVQANRYLGRPYSLEGEVIHGEHRGNRLGFATANMDIAPDRLLPATGVYACRAYFDGMSYTAVTNIGVRPTFANPLASPRVEPHLLDLKENLYGQFLRLDLLEYLRPEQAFDSPDELIAQVNRDILRTRELFDHDQ
jgi:riboflavin kinase / FMN adenylyltransferase